MDSQRVKKIAKWGGLGVALVILVVAGTAATIFFTAGSRFEGRLESLVPQNAVVMLRFNQLGSQLESLQGNTQALLGHKAMEKVAVSKAYQDQFEPGGYIAPNQIWEYNVDPVLVSLRNNLANMPISLSLEDDLLGEQTLVALVPDDLNEELVPLLITRVSSDMAGSWQFSGFAEGDHGATNISSDGDLMEIASTNESGESSSVYLSLFNDVLIASASRSAVNSSLGLREALMDAQSYLSHPLYQSAEDKLAETSKGQISAIANLDALRQYQGIDEDDLNLPEEEQRAPIDNYFSIPSSVLQLSPMLLPTINDVLHHAIDTRAFGMAAWNFDISQEGRLEIHQHLIVNPDSLGSKELEHLKKSWSQGAMEWDFLKFLPKETWFIGNVHQALDTVGADVKPVVNDEGEEEASAVYSILKAIEKQGEGKVDSVGCALLPTNQRYWANPANPADRALIAQGIISQASFPPFVFFMHWPDATVEDVHALMQEQLAIQGVQKIRATIRPLNQSRVVRFEPQPNQDPPAWVVAQMACGVIGDYMVITLSKNLTAMIDMLDASNSLADQGPALFGQTAASGYAMVYLRPQGFEQFSRIVRYEDHVVDPDHPERISKSGKAIDLAQAISETKFKEDFPFDMDSRDFRKQIADSFGVTEPPADPRVTRKFFEGIAEWTAKREPYAMEVRSNIRMFTAIKHFLAATRADTESMHTHFIIELDD